jgi:hypothetical protein
MTTTPSHVRLYAAYALSLSRWHVFPVMPDAKMPLLPAAHSKGDPLHGRCVGQCGRLGHGVHDATLDKLQIQRWWERWPDANIGVATGKVSGITVIDIDGKEGEEAIKALGLPQTWTVKTPRGGWHLYFTYTPALHTGAGILPQVDIRNDGGYVLVEPSTVGGKPYRVVRDEPGVATLLEIPGILTRRSRSSGELPTRPDGIHTRQQEGDQWIVRALGGVTEGQRNETAARLIGYYHGKGIPEDIIAATLWPWAQACLPPMDMTELERTVRSVTRYGDTESFVQKNRRDGVNDFRALGL